MDRVFPPTRTARTMRERVEARRAREQRGSTHNLPGARLTSSDAKYRDSKIAAPGEPYDPPDSRPADSGAYDPPVPHPELDEWSVARRSAPVRFTGGSMAVPRHHGPHFPHLRRPASGGGSRGSGWNNGRGSGGGRGWKNSETGGPSILSRIAGGAAREWKDLDPELQGIAKRVMEFIVAVAVVAGLVVGLFSSGGHSAGAAANITDAEPTPTAGVAAGPAPAEPVRIMLLGSDRRSGDSGYRTDVMLLVTIDAADKKITVLSFPRDLVGKIPGYGDGRINIVMGQGGFSLMQDTFEKSYGVRPDYYFLINFEGFVGLINSIGGIEINAANALEDSCDLPQSRAGICTIEPGKHSMDGATALWYVRSRHSSSDFDRLRRAQEVMAGIFNRMMSMKAVSRLPELYLQYSQDVETNMTIPQIASLIPSAMDVAANPKEVKRYAIPEEIVADWFMPDGARVLLPDYEAVKKYVRKAALIK